MPSQRDPCVASPRGETHRLFLALWPDAALRQRIAATTTQLAAAHGIRGRRLQPQRYHLTLQFLGDFPALGQAPLASAMAAADRVRVAAFELSLARASSFGQVGWLGPEDLPAGLQQLWDTLGLALAEHGVRTRPAATWIPHVTVLRDMRQPLPPTVIPPLSWSVDRFVLIHSQPGRNADYALLHHWPLQA